MRHTSVSVWIISSLLLSFHFQLAWNFQEIVACQNISVLLISSVDLGCYFRGYVPHSSLTSNFQLKSKADFTSLQCFGIQFSCLNILLETLNIFFRASLHGSYITYQELSKHFVVHFEMFYHYVSYAVALDKMLTSALPYPDRNSQQKGALYNY